MRTITNNSCVDNTQAIRMEQGDNMKKQKAIAGYIITQMPLTHKHQLCTSSKINDCLPDLTKVFYTMKKVACIFIELQLQRHCTLFLQNCENTSHITTTYQTPEVTFLCWKDHAFWNAMI
jgi:hypothetical protein